MSANVSFGGVAGFDRLADPTNSTALRVLGSTRLYLHATAVQTAYDDGTLGVIATLFRATPADAELGFQVGANAISLFYGWVTRVILRSGFTVGTASINGFTPGKTSPTAWDDYVDLARAVGIATVSPVFSPNSSGWSLNWASSTYDPLRAAALYGGGLTIDAPPGFFAAQSAAYRGFIENEIRWATGAGVRTSVIISPYGPAAGFAQATTRFVQTLEAAGAVPTTWVVENYQTSVPASAVDQIGAETSANSIDAVALQVAQTARTPPPPPAIATIVMQANHAIRAGADTAQLTTMAGERHVVAMPSTNAGVVSLGCDTIDGGAGSDTVWAGAGAISVHGGTGNLTVHGGGGVANISLKSGTSDLVTLGSGGGVVFMGGTDTVSAGSGSDIFQFTHGIGGHDVIQGFVPGRDTITLLNYTAVTPAAALSGARDTATGTILTFGDGTTVTLSGLHHVTASLFG